MNSWRYKQVKTHLSEEDAKKLTEVRNRFGFRSDYQFVSVCVKTILKILSDNSRHMKNHDGDSLDSVFDEFANSESLELGTVKPTMRQTEIKNKEFVDRFIDEYYTKALCGCSSSRNHLHTNMHSRIDICHEVILSLYFTEENFPSYDEFKRYALSKIKVDS